MRYLAIPLLMVFATACAEMQAVDKYKLEKAERQAQYAQEKAQIEEAEKKAYWDWYNALSYEDQLKETRYQAEQRERIQAREDAMLLNHAFIASQNLNAVMSRGPMFNFTPSPHYVPSYSNPVPAYQPSRRCTSTLNGSEVYTNCY